MQTERPRHGSTRRIHQRSAERLAAGPAAVAALTLAMLSAGPVSAGLVAITPGFDLLATGAGSTMPGSVFGLPGDVALEGVPLSANWSGGYIGNTDTIISRQAEHDFGEVPPEETAPPIPAEVVALHLRSVDSIAIFGGAMEYFVHATINREVERISAAGGNDDGVCDAGETCFKAAGNLPFFDQPVNPPTVQLSIPNSRGQMEIRAEDASGGDWLDCFGMTSDTGIGVCDRLGLAGGGVFFDLWAVAVGDDLVADGIHLIDEDQPYPADLRIAISCANPGACIWSTIRPENYPMPADFPSGGFYPGSPVIHDGPHPEVFLATPEIDAAAAPAALSLLLGGLALRRERRRRRLGR